MRGRDVGVWFGNVWPLVKRIIDDGLIENVTGFNIVGVSPSSHGAPWFLKRDLAGGVLINTRRHRVLMWDTAPDRFWPQLLPARCPIADWLLRRR